MENSIAATLATCLRRFARVVNSTKLQCESEVPISLWRDELGRLRHIRDQTIQLLRNVTRWFDDLEDVLGEASPWPGEEEVADDGSSDHDAESIPEIQQICEGLVETITCLHQLSMAIRRPTQHDRILGTRNDDAKAYEFFDRQHVANKFPHADASLIDRLGAAISRRRAALRYRKRHHEKLAHGLDSEESERATTELSATVATEFIEENANVRDDRSDAGHSQTSYAPSLFNSADRLTAPVPKSFVTDEPFECPYRYFIIAVSDRKAWARHVFQDISPYICPFDHCPSANRLYWRQGDWYSHIHCEHPDLFETGGAITCPLCKDQLPYDRLKRHLSRHLEELALFAVPRPDSSGDEGLDITRDPSVDSERPDNFASSPVAGVERDSCEDQEERTQEMQPESDQPSPGIGQVVSNDKELFERAING
ncbi:hypothetical protein BJX66DRAFT_347986 [Aspergillus keveii]|uniref:Oxidoreductase acuF-like C2H2 type zinc-finger domain-containing protein n=1 Tax=Aspergillus keveii TaxID=714993 RepID=A0ABR4FNH2_9EURO